MRRDFGFRVVPFALAMFLTALSYADTIDAAKAYSALDHDSPQTLSGLTANQRQALWSATSQNSVAKLSMVSHYDPDGSVGFCFGRAMTAHLIARKMGLADSSIKKLFIIGDLRSGDDPEWRFHVTTVVKGQEDGKWYAIDPIMLPPMAFGTPLPAQQWIDIVQSVWDKSKQAHFYFADNDSVLPDITRFGATKADETGEHIIELTFNPVGKAGFHPFTFATTPVSDLDAIAQSEQFLRANERFDFLKLSMTVYQHGQANPQEYAFNGYFLDLLDNLTREAAEPAAASRALQERATTNRPLGLGSMRLKF